jgi:hypothetical protein
VLEPGMKVEILEQQGAGTGVRLGDMEGWMSASTLLTDAMRDHIQEGGRMRRSTGHPEYRTPARDANLRVDPGRNTAVLRLIPERSPVEILDAGTIPKEGGPRTRRRMASRSGSSPTEIGWLLSHLVQFDVPEGIAPYTEDYVYSAVKP